MRNGGCRVERGLDDDVRATTSGPVVWSLPPRREAVAQPGEQRDVRPLAPRRGPGGPRRPREVGVDHARLDHRDADAERPDLDRERLGDRRDARTCWRGTCRPAGSTSRAPIDEMTTTEPPPASRMPGQDPLDHGRRAEEVGLEHRANHVEVGVLHGADHRVAGVADQAGERRRPAWRSAAATPAATDAASATSSRVTCTPVPAYASRPPRRRARRRRRASPRARKASAQARPIPRPAPVTSAVGLPSAIGRTLPRPARDRSGAGGPGAGGRRAAAAGAA